MIDDAIMGCVGGRLIHGGSRSAPYKRSEAVIDPP